MRKFSEGAYKFKQALRGVFFSETELRKSQREATNNEEWNPDIKILYDIADTSQQEAEFDLILNYIERKVKNVKKSCWRRYTKVVELMIFLVKNGNEAFINRFIDRENIFDKLKVYSYTENKIDRGAIVRERTEYLQKLMNDKDSWMEERIAAYRLRFGRVPEWAKEYLEKKSLSQKREGRGIKLSLGKGKKAGGLILNTKNLESDESSSSGDKSGLRDVRARTDQFFSVPGKFAKSKKPVFNWNKVAEEGDSDSDYESKDKVGPLETKKNPYVGMGGGKKKGQISGTQSVGAVNKKFDFSGFNEEKSSSGDEDYSYGKTGNSNGGKTTSFMAKGNLTDSQKQASNGSGKFFGKSSKIDAPGLRPDTKVSDQQEYDFSNADGFGVSYVDPEFRKQIDSKISPEKVAKPFVISADLDFGKVKRKYKEDDCFGEFDGVNIDQKKTIKLSINKTKK